MRTLNLLIVLSLLFACAVPKDAQQESAGDRAARVKSEM